VRRLFVSIEPPEDVREDLLAICYGLPGARWVDSEQFHLTLRFIGEVDGAVFREIDEALAQIDTASFDLTVQGVGHFPPRGVPQVLWAGIERSEALLHLRRKIEVAIVQTGLEPDHRKYSPHITLARLQGTHPNKVGEFLARHNLLRTRTFPIDEFHLFSSKLTPKHAIHTCEASYSLRKLRGAEWEEK
jgi:RNA 2',3'-cyclic 3'-phosphodiesterase